MARKKGGLTAKEGALVRQLGPPPGARTEEEWEREILRRLDEVDAGTAKTVDAYESTERAFASLRRGRGGH